VKGFNKVKNYNDSIYIFNLILKTAIIYFNERVYDCIASATSTLNVPFVLSSLFCTANITGSSGVCYK
jgi:hypothetical protein